MCDQIKLWPRGLFTYNADFSLVPRREPYRPSQDITTACRLVVYHAYYHKSGRVTVQQWHKMAVLKAGIDDSAAKAIFDAVVLLEHILPFGGRVKQSDTVSLACLALLLATSCAGKVLSRINETRGQFRSTREQWKENLATPTLWVHRHMAANLDQLLAIAVLSSEETMGVLIKSPKGKCSVGSSVVVPTSSLLALDYLFEGVVLPSNGPVVAEKLTLMPFSQIALKYWTVDDRITFSTLLQNTAASLQQDPYSLHDRFISDDECINISASKNSGSLELERMMVLKMDNEVKGEKAGGEAESPSPSSTQAPSRKKSKHLSKASVRSHCTLFINGWTHIEVLNDEVYIGCNLRIANGSSASSSLFAPHYAESVVLVDCHSCGDIVLGPVRNTVFLQGLSNCRVSVFCSRVVVQRCSNIVLNVSTPLSPLLIECDAVRLAPYNVYYDHLKSALKDADMELLQSNNSWNAPLMVSHLFAGEATVCVDLLNSAVVEKPEVFDFQPTPFSQRNDSEFKQAFMDSLPNEYRKAALRNIAKAAVYARRSASVQQRIKVLNDVDRRYLERKIAQGVTFSRNFKLSG